MLSLLFLAKKKKQTLEESVHLIQQGDKKLNDDLIEAYKPFIAKTVSVVCKRYIVHSDDEFSIGLIAFNEAIQKYSPERGSSLLSFAEVLIKRRVIDYIRQQAKNPTVSLELQPDIGDSDSRVSIIENEISLDDYRKKTDEERRREEIFRFQAHLRDFELSFHDLVEQAPKHADARKNAIQAAKLLAEDKELRESLFEKKRLPIKQLEEMVHVSRKTLERNRRYIIAMTLILSGDYVYMKDYIKGVLES
ncbi:RNA polymerase sigma factor SigI [Neobacillus notoginsengisoli]|uniref:RNA polymerase sigma factor SigI n=2 Tax=Neobacillus notoginsengisoli TaxID=1578198 RepID=A0A417YFC4_9BACI|nr:RNA polymerase sigma factor SigI [Neobacillus notoginsengisoli]